jgi:hypothetical protein
MSSKYSNAKILAPSQIEVFSNSSNFSSSRLSSVIIADVHFFNATSTAIFLVASGTGTNPLTFIGEAISLNVSALCLPGQFVDFGPHSENSSGLFDYFSAANVTNLCTKCLSGTVSAQESPISCTECPIGTFSNSENTYCKSCMGNTWAPKKTQSSCFPCSSGYLASKSHDRCFTLKFRDAPPLFLVSSIPNVLPAIIVIDNFNQTAQNAAGPILASLVCMPPACSAPSHGIIVQSVVFVQNGSSVPKSQVVLDDSDDAIGGGYLWNFTSIGTDDISSNLTLPVGISVLHPESITLLGPQPSIFVVEPTLSSFAGDTVVTLQASAWTLLNRMQSLLSSNNSDLSARCQFLFSASKTSPLNFSAGVVEVVSVTGTDSSRRTCMVPSSSPLGIWAVKIVLADGRSSKNFVQIGSVCPNSFFLKNANCQPCPASEDGRSFNEEIDARTVESCRCSVGSYGSFGAGCKRCPQLSGFNCTSPDQSLPIVQPGYYGDYSLLEKCSWQDVSCPALLTCPYGARACPGGGDKLCTQNDAECYTGLACSACCPLYYLESGICHQCPDSSTSTTILAVLAVFICIVAILISTSESPSFTHSIKYFILMMNFSQNLTSVKLINIEWPSELLQMFNSLRFFSFSIAAVRPECSFSWTFETKILVSLMLPIALSFIVCMSGIIYGAHSCRKLYRQIQTLRANDVKLPYMSFSSLVNCWLHVVFFRPVNWHPRYFMWFALSPYLESRSLGRQLRTPAENWSVLRSTIKSRLAIGRIFGSMQRSNRVQPMVSDYDVKVLQRTMHTAGLDSSFAGIVFKGRKFASGVFSIIVLSFVGTLTSAISATICEERDGMLFLVQDPTFECSLSTSRYSILFAIAIGAILLYAVVVPAILVILLRSRWSKDMRAGDRTGFDALFGFLTSRYSVSCYMWESVVFVHKGLSVVIPSVYSGSPLQQSVAMMFVSLVYVVLLFRFSPFVNQLMNSVEKATSFSIFMMYFIAVMIVCEVDRRPILDKTQKSLAAILLCIVCATSATFCLFSSLYEYYFLLLLHGDLFISKWYRAFESAIGDSLKQSKNDSMFLFFYTFYNPKSRRSIVFKKRKLNESIAILTSLQHSDVWKSGSVWVRFKLYVAYMWQWLRFVFLKKKNIIDCEPMIVREALDHPESRLFQRLIKIRHLHKNSKSQSHQHGLFKRMMLFCKRAIFCQQAESFDVEPKSAFKTALAELDPPPEFMSNFSKRYKYLSDALSDNSIRMLMTIILFDQEGDMGDSMPAKAYVQEMLREFEPAKAALRSIFSVVSSIAEIERQAQKDQSWIVQTAKKVFLGFKGSCLMRFSTLSDREMGELLAGKGFSEFSKWEMLVVPVKQLVSLFHSKAANPLRKTNIQAESSLAADNLAASQSIQCNSTRMLHRSASSPASEVSQPPPTSHNRRPLLYAAKQGRSAADAWQSTVRLTGTSQPDSIVSLQLKLDALKKDMAALEAQADNNEKNFQRALRAKDQEISALQSTAAFLMKKNRFLAHTLGQDALQTQGGNRSIRTHFQELSEMRVKNQAEIWIPNDKDDSSEHE